MSIVKSYVLMSYNLEDSTEGPNQRQIKALIKVIPSKFKYCLLFTNLLSKIKEADQP